MAKRTPWQGNGDGHVYEHVMTPPEPRTWTWRDCPSFVLVTHPENAPADPQKGRPLRERKGLSRTTYLDGRPRETKRQRAARILAENAPMVQRDRGE